jgi:hypothetical protein
MLAEKTTVWNGTTVVDRDKLDATRRAVAKHIRWCATTVTHRSHRPLGYWGAQPCKVDWVLVNLDDEPLAPGEVTGAANGWPVPSGEYTSDEKFEIETTKRQHRNFPPFSLRYLAEPTDPNLRHTTSTDKFSS